MISLLRIYKANISARSRDEFNIYEKLRVRYIEFKQCLNIPTRSFQKIELKI